MSRLQPTRLASNAVGPQDAFVDPFAAARRLQTPVWVYDIDNFRVAYANAAACHMWQADDEAMLQARDMGKDMSSTVAKRLKQYQIDFIARDASFNEMWTLYPNGEPTSVMVIFSSFRLDDGRMAMLCEVVGKTDDEPENLRSVEALLHTDVMITLYSVDGPPFYMNPAARNVSPNSLQSFSELFADIGDHAMLMLKLDATGEERIVAKVITMTGSRWYDLSAKLCSDAVTGQPAILVTATDVTDLKTARDTARYLADRDQLTGCYNRAYLQQHIALLAARQTEPCALIYFDLDRFKQVNDQFGHEVGDVVLREIAARARIAIRKDDIVVRLGGDEFVILLESVPQREALASKVDALMADFSLPIIHESTRINMSVSVGISVFVPNETDFTVAMRQADIALYASKQAGRNRFIFFDEEMGAAARERDLIQSELESAVHNNEFVLFYQPRIDMSSGRVVSVEALVRWQHPERGLIMPDVFIPVCEETGLIEMLGQHVLRMGCEQIAIWHKMGLDLELSLNVSPRQFKDKRLMQFLKKLSSAPDFPSGKVELEITENVLIGDRDLIAKKLQDITNMGFRIAIDDFGTGYSNLSYISRFPLECIKIDRSFINQLPKSGPIVHLILALSRQIGATVVAEGVETEDEYNWLKAEGCNQVQGFFLARPVPEPKLRPVVEKLDAWLAKHSEGEAP